ncbi:hypothetical protein [Pseudoxanthomonas sp. CF125]|uniref:hypothetical protein n=1 Tax=Pseudoxanthomonas sp. CF125 TaxID=1855303 RepID=UPI001C408F1C|nr:hypothetical protein [Pseudoxanthomonas sp. CF125]
MTSRAIVALGETLEYFDNAGTDQTPRGLVCLLRSLYERLNRQSKFLAWPQAGYNFTIRSLVVYLKELFRYLGADAEVSAVFSAYSGPQDLVSFPRVERDNVAMFSIFGHELGHPIADAFLQMEATSAAHQARGLRARQDIIQALGGSPTMPELQAAIQAVFQLRRRALEELISDTVGVYLFGPSALFAGYQILMWNTLDVIPSRQNEGYPPGRMRIRVSLEVARAEGHIDALRNLTTDQVVGPTFSNAGVLLDHLEQLASDNSDELTINTSPIARIAYDWISTTLPSAQQFARTELATARYEDSTLKLEVPRLVERLKHGLPPNEIGDSLSPVAVDERSAVLAGWLVSLEASQAGTNPDQAINELSRLNEKALKGLEYVVLQRRYRSGTRTSPS